MNFTTFAANLGLTTKTTTTLSRHYELGQHNIWLILMMITVMVILLVLWCLSRRLKFNTLYSLQPRFSQARTELRDEKRVVFVGLTGAGKSTLLNILGGWKGNYVEQDDADLALEWDPSELLFPPKTSGVHSTTQSVQFAALNWQGDNQRPFLAIDTPGHNDTGGIGLGALAARLLGGHSAQMHNKLKALGHIHAIVILHDNPSANMVNPEWCKILQMIETRFQKYTDVWTHVVIAFSKCNECDTTWRAGIQDRMRDLQKNLKERTDLPMCNIDVPVVALGGLTRRLGEEPDAKRRKVKDDFDKLWEFIKTASPLGTTRLIPYQTDPEKHQIIKWSQVFWKVLAEVLMFAILFTGRWYLTTFGDFGVAAEDFQDFLYNKPEFGCWDELGLLSALVCLVATQVYLSTD